MQCAYKARVWVMQVRKYAEIDCGRDIKLVDGVLRHTETITCLECAETHWHRRDFNHDAVEAPTFVEVFNKEAGNE